MKKLLVVLGLLVLVPGLAFAQGTYYVDYYANNWGANTILDQIVRIVNVGTLGTPLTAPKCPATGCICANIYVFDANQEMQSCCAEALTPNELDSAYVGRQLTGINPVTHDFATLTGLAPDSGVIKIVLTPEPAAGCDPRTPFVGADAGLGAVWGTHVQNPGSGYGYVTETEKLSRTLSAAEAAFLPNTCQFVWYLGSGRGVCYSKISTGQY
jgi:hypothetical protein